MMSDDIKDNFLSSSQWLRILYMALFAVVCWLLVIILSVVVIAQILFSLITGKNNDNLRQLGASLSRYFHDALLFLTYGTENKPFPFAPFPTAEIPPDESEPFSEDEPEPPAEDEPESPAATRDNPVSKEGDVFSDISFTADETGNAGSAKEDKEEKNEKKAGE